MQPSFIDDLIPLILGAHDHLWTSDLRALCLVSRSWHHFASKQLYQQPELRSYKACTQLARTFQGNHTLETCITSLDIRPDGNQRADMQAIRYLLGLKGITSLKLGGKLAHQTERFLHLVSHPQDVQSLHIDGATQDFQSSLTCGPPAAFEWDEALAFKFHNLRHLRLASLELEIVYPSTPYHLPLQSLSLDNVVIDGELPWLAHKSWAELDSLSITTCNEAESNLHVKQMITCCRNMRKLRYEVKYRSNAQDPIFDADVPNCTSMREVALGGRFDLPLLETVSQYCPSLEVLVVLGRSAVTPVQWKGFLEGQRVSNLMKELVIPLATYTAPFQFQWSDGDVSSVRDVCMKRRIQLLTSGLR
ncbi:hypothetical protein BDV98DRAFT_522196 [Pterulicium gracile]|uniref:F-box domain-containing protein n=1 Tax=Pterulicium gracile TaxID=1884261 RepID=A0A5C3QXP5_9AGAR|nr:hypothetical protein BDV98DRAFT_522196 [Pterula gracilis]